MDSRERLLNSLDNYSIVYDEYALTGEEFPPPKEFWEEKKILRCKNLFFRDNHGQNHFLVITDFYRKIDIKKLQELTGRGSMTLASGWRLKKYLGLEPGFISVFGLLNDKDDHVQVIIAKELVQEKDLSFLPNTIGGSFIAISFSELTSYLNKLGKKVFIADF